MVVVVLPAVKVVVDFAEHEYVHPVSVMMDTIVTTIVSSAKSITVIVAIVVVGITVVVKVVVSTVVGTVTVFVTVGVVIIQEHPCEIKEVAKGFKTNINCGVGLFTVGKSDIPFS